MKVKKRGKLKDGTPLEVDLSQALSFAMIAWLTGGKILTTDPRGITPHQLVQEAAWHMERWLIVGLQDHLQKSGRRSDCHRVDGDRYIEDLTWNDLRRAIIEAGEYASRLEEQEDANT